MQKRPAPARQGLGPVRCSPLLCWMARQSFSSRLRLMAAEMHAVSRRAGVTLASTRKVPRNASRSMDGQKGSVLIWPLGVLPLATNPLMRKLEIGRRWSGCYRAALKTLPVQPRAGGVRGDARLTVAAYSAETVCFFRRRSAPSRSFLPPHPSCSSIARLSRSMPASI